MKNYELSIIAKTDTEPAMQKLAEDVKKILIDQGAEITKDTLPARMRLGYEIQDQNEGILLSFAFSFDEEKLGELRKTIDEDHRILRHMLINAKTYQRKTSPRRKKKEETKIDDSIKVEIVKEDKTNLEDIDKKLDEMLNK